LAISLHTLLCDIYALRDRDGRRWTISSIHGLANWPQGNLIFNPILLQIDWVLCWILIVKQDSRSESVSYDHDVVFAFAFRPHDWIHLLDRFHSSVDCNGSHSLTCFYDQHLGQCLCSRDTEKWWRTFLDAYSTWNLWARWVVRPNTNLCLWNR